MNNRKWMRPLLIVLVIAMLASSALSVSGAQVVGDINGDGKISVFDAQLLLEAQAGLRKLSESQLSITVDSIIDYIFGKHSMDIADMNGDGVLEIYTAEGLTYMAENPSLDYILAADIDLKGAAWKPISGFSGTFYGNGHTISNVQIAGGTAKNVGFFGDTTADSIINKLELRNATLTATGNAQFVGLAIGISRGTVKNCTVTGSITDTRTSTASGGKIYVGGMVGSVTSGSVTGGTTVTVTDDYGLYSVSGLCGEISLRIKEGTSVVSEGLYGRLLSGATITGDWRDASNCAAAVSETMQERQNTVVDYMNAMGTVAWTVSETLTYSASGVHNQVFKPGVIRYGLPYNGRNGGMERFLSCMVDNGADGTEEDPYVAKTGLGDGSKTEPAGFMLYMGNDCSDAVGWSWMQVSPNRTAGSSTNEYAGGVYVNVTRWMIPTTQSIYVDVVDDKGNLVYQTNADGSYVLDDNGNKVVKQTMILGDNQGNNGIYPVGNWTTVSTGPDSNGNYFNDDIADTSKFAYQVPTLAAKDIPANSASVVNIPDNTKAILELNGEEVMAEAYALTRKADAVLFYTGSESTSGDGGHARLVTSYPVTIRNAEGTIDCERSFLVCTEQGDGLYDTSDVKDENGNVIKKGGTSSWRVNFKWTFNNLMGNKKSTDLKASGGVYVPITIRALRADYVKYAYIDEYPTNPVTSPVTGTTYCNWRVLYSTVTVQDADGNELYKDLKYAGVTVDPAGRNATVDLAKIHGADFKAFAQENLTEGETYYYSVDVTMSNGETLNIGRNCIGNKHSGETFETFVYSSALFGDGSTDTDTDAGTGESDDTSGT